MANLRNQMSPISSEPDAGAALRMSKIGAARYDLNDPYHIALTVNWPGFLAIVAVLYFAVNLVFAGLYFVSPGSVAEARPGAFLDVFFFSIETLATVGYGEMHPGSDYGHWIAGLEIITGMAFTAIVTGLIFVRFSKPRAKILHADKVVVTRHNGQQTLMVRIGNGRMNALTEADIRLSVLLRETTTEGLRYRRSCDLKLAQPHYAIFPLTLMPMHAIDQDSPLYGFDMQKLKDEEIRLFVSLQAYDPALGANIADLKTYTAEQFMFGTRFVDTISTDDDGRTTADLRAISTVEPDGF
ncbi:MAG: hypothetical protein JWP35_3474 [Caulobacter sp.]|nr:hypothetical protein [Caulobacter sp.]